METNFLEDCRFSTHQNHSSKESHRLYISSIKLNGIVIRHVVNIPKCVTHLKPAVGTRTAGS